MEILVLVTPWNQKVVCHERLHKYGWVSGCNIGSWMNISWIKGDSIQVAEKRVGGRSNGWCCCRKIGQCIEWVPQ